VNRKNHESLCWNESVNRRNNRPKPETKKNQQWLYRANGADGNDDNDDLK